MLRSKFIFLAALSLMSVCLLGIAFAGGQPAKKAGLHAAPQTSLHPSVQAAKEAADKPLMSQDVDPTTQVLRGIPEDQFMDTMGFFAASLSMNCTDCHVDAALTTWSRFADETPNMRTARKMVTMVRAINQSYFDGQTLVTCYTCHHDSPGPPDVVPSLALQYANPIDVEPQTINRQAADQPLPDKIWADYIAAIGGQQAVDALTSYTATGTYEGFDTEHARVPVEIYVKAPGERAMIVHSLAGLSKTITDGRSAWLAAVTKSVPLLPLTGGDLDGAKVDAIVALPSQISANFTKWRTGNEFTVDDRDVYVVQGTSAGKSPVKFYFDEKTGLLVRLVRYTNTIVGTIPEQIDYSDYRDVAGVKLPFQTVVTWTNGQSTIILNDVKPNVSIDASQFDKPAPAVSTLRRDTPPTP
jgi:outer membrane lipoprotein-sorting protein